MEGQIRFLILAVALVFARSEANAAVSVPSPKFRDVLYSAKILTETSDSQNLHLRLGTVKRTRSSKSRLIAVINGEGNSVEAVCERVVGYETTRSYVQVTMLCEGPLFPEPSITAFTVPNPTKHLRLKALIKSQAQHMNAAKRSPVT